MQQIKIGNITTKNNLFLAPMCGITDLPFREMVEEFGECGLMFPEMLPSRSIQHKDYGKKSKSTFEINAMQISGNDAYYMSEAAKKNVDLGAELIDLNFGCPVKKVVKGFAGAAIMKDENLVKDLIRAVVKAVNVPVSVKMRMGWSTHNLNAPVIAKIAEGEGVQMVTVHGRTREQMYSGVADWKFVSRVKEVVKIPVIVNGDIRSSKDVINALKESNADGVMVARGIYGKPYLFKQISDELLGKVFVEPTGGEKISMVLKHIDKLVNYYDEKIGIQTARKHIAWYSNGLRNSADFRNRINKIEKLGELKGEIERFFL